MACAGGARGRADATETGRKKKGGPSQPPMGGELAGPGSRLGGFTAPAASNHVRQDLIGYFFLHPTRALGRDNHLAAIVTEADITSGLGAANPSLVISLVRLRPGRTGSPRKSPLAAATMAAGLIDS